MIDLILLFLIIIIPLIADIGIKATYRKYLKVKSNDNLTGLDTAKLILAKNGLEDIYVVQTNGFLTDHYDPSRKVVRLSKAVYEGSSVASIAIAAHECGHALQDKDNYTFMKIRSKIVPIVNIATSISYWIILIGLLLEMFDLIYLGIGFTCFGLLFQIITLPVEFNASKRASEQISKHHLASVEQQNGVKKVLTSAALTYIAGVLASLLQIIRLVLMFRDND